ncbi:MAG: hypothetical protein ACP5J4_19920 [Anaerolineae bacterium]
MNLDQSRLLLLAASTTPLWTGEVVSWNVADFELTVTTLSGSYPTEIGNLLLVQNGVNIARIKSRSGDVLTLAETPVQFLATYTLAIYDARLPWPRYQYIDDGVVYKDRDIAFPTPWQREMPPTAILKARLSGNDWGEAIYCATGDTIYLDASESYGNLDDAAPLSYAWTPGPGGTITGSGATVTCAYTTEGFRYLKLVVTDAHGTTISRYLPVWVGDGLAVGAVTAARARWSVAQGWTVDLDMQSATSLLQYGPALLVDMETKNALFFGFVVPSSRAQTFELTTQSLTLQSALAFSRYVHAYPFLVTAVTGAAEPSEWAEMYDPTLARALWYLLYWHSTLPEVVNCDAAAAPVREIAGQEFTLGSVPQQVDAILKSAFWQARGARAGGFVVDTDPLFLDATDWAALSALDLSAAASLRNAINCEYAVPQHSQARLGGIYRAAGGTFEPALVQSPAYPGPWGSPTEVNGLAPEDVNELIDWAIRYIAVENTADTYSVEPGVVVDPSAYRVADLPGSIRIAVEQMTLDFDPDGLRWRQTLGGRAYGYNIGSAVGVPLPPPVVYPPPDLPPIEPPVWPPFPEESDWPVYVWVGTLNLGVYYSGDFTDPDSSDQPTWAADNSGLPDMSLSRYTLMRFAGDPDDQREQMCIVHDTGVSPETRTIYTRSLAGTWSAALTETAAATLIGTGYTVRLRDCVYDAEGGSLWAVYGRGDTNFGPMWLLQSTNNGGAWSLVSTTAFTYYFYNGTLYVRGSEVAIGAGFSSGGQQKIRYSSDGGSTFALSDNRLGSSSWQSCPYITPSGKLYINGSEDEAVANGPDLIEVDKSTLTFSAVLGSYDLGPESPDALWENPSNTLHGRILKNSQLWVTLDGWTTLEDTSPAVYTPALSRLFVPVPGAPGVIFLAQTSPTETYPHLLYIIDGEAGALLPRAGDDPGTSPYTNSIPRTCGGLARDPNNTLPTQGGGGGLAVW